ncbi:hypothetical protein M6B38_311765 [Iris pallida]|uniref:Uncharacterized protein n=1 Tax=Iris pallida TaxID=29817 RepID=A0AAX6HFM3_IRIPA|nr:hypothetical protein M6B38_311765 [Iris pallida]
MAVEELMTGQIDQSPARIKVVERPQSLERWRYSLEDARPTEVTEAVEFGHGRRRQG